MNPISTETLDDTLSALAAFLEDAGAAPEHLVLFGGAALLALGLVSRTTRDMDIMAGVDARVGLVDPRPMSEALTMAAAMVARELDLDPHWLNTGPADQVQAGLPEGFLTRLTRREYGAHLIIYLPARCDLIHLKLFAAVDQGVGRHTRDLAALQPTEDELLAAARWAAPGAAVPAAIISKRAIGRFSPAASRFLAGFRGLHSGGSSRKSLMRSFRQEKPPKHSALLSSRLRETLAAQGQELAAAGLLPLLDLRSTAPGTEILATLAERLPAALDRL